ncbi:MAG TPA: hypothetical protein VGY51_13290 [Acidimicrobiales bacterium]|nr:hypothetical protein [Acidimicrobiales bacterium]
MTSGVDGTDGGSSAPPSFLGPDDLPVFVQDHAIRSRVGDGSGWS